LYSDRASHFFETPQAGGPVDQERLTQVGRALKELGIQMIPTYSLQTRGRAERRLAPGKDGCHKSCAWRGSPGWKKPTGFCASVTFRRSSASSAERQRRKVTPSGARLGLDQIFSVQAERVVA